MPKKSKTIAFIGLGRMGSAMSAHLADEGFHVHGYDASKDVMDAIADTDVTTHNSLEACIEALPSPRVVWIMVPSQFVDTVISDLKSLLIKGDCIIDGGNSFFKDSVFRQHELDGRGIDFLDCGTSGGVDGARCGASLMVGGDPRAVKKCAHFFEALAEDNGYGFVGGPGAGHFVKMVHNGIEYGMMGAIAEGINTLHEHKDGMQLNIKEAIKAYEHGSIIESNLMSWLADAYKDEKALHKIAGEVPRGETEMEMEYLVDHNRVRVLTAALTQRKLTRSEPSFIGTLISAIRNQFGGHAVKFKKERDQKSNNKSMKK